MACGTGLFCLSSSMMEAMPSRISWQGWKNRGIMGMVPLFWPCTFFLALPLVLTFSSCSHPLSIWHICLDKGCLHLWWEYAKYGEGQCSLKITFISRQIKGQRRMLGGTVRKAVPGCICNNRILAVVSDNLFPGCTRTYSISHGCAKRPNSTHLPIVSNSAQHMQLDGFSVSN